MDRDTSLGHLPPLGISSASLGRVGWEVFGKQWSGMASCKSHKYCIVNVRIAKVSSLTVFRKGGKFKNWMLE